MTLTPLQEELGVKEYARLAEAWRLRLAYRLSGMAAPFHNLPDSYFDDGDDDDALSA